MAHERAIVKSKSNFSLFTLSWFALSLFTLFACSHAASVPTAYTDTTDSLCIYPDYRDVVVPPNIAPLNFMVTDAAAEDIVVQVGDLVCGASSDGKIDIDTTAWRQLLATAKGHEITVCVYAQRPAGWVRYRPFSIGVAEEDIDPYLSYRLIEPGYELYRQLGLYQRNLTNFDEFAIYENNRTFSDDDNHCVNCHNYQANDTERMLFHVRSQHGGTVIVHGTEAHKVAIKHDSILSAGVYPSWHPTLPLVAFSTNRTGQVFHMQHREKIEVLDEASDLLLYDAEANTVRNVLRTDDALETFPCWSPDGQRLFYCSARVPASVTAETDNHAFAMALRYDSLLYDIYSMPFDAKTQTFGQPRLEVDASSQGLSASVPRISPDGRYLLYTLGQYGQFHIWHKSADLWVKPLSPVGESQANDELQGINDELRMTNDESSIASSHQRPSDSSSDIHHSSFVTPHSSLLGYPLTEANSPDADSYHAWSSNNRWIVFSSRRDDGNFTRPYIAYFNRQGRAHRPFLLPQRDPEYNLLLLKSYNVPELTRNPLRVSRETLNHVVLHTAPEAATYLSR